MSSCFDQYHNNNNNTNEYYYENNSKIMNRKLLCTRRRKHRNTIVTVCKLRIMSTLSSLLILLLVSFVGRTDGSSSTTKPNSIVSIIIKSPIGTPKLLEQFIELPIVASNRNIQSIKQSIQRQWLQISTSSSTSSGQQIKPPLSIIHISYKGQLLNNNDMTIQEILEDDDDDEDEEDDNDSGDNIEDNDDDQKTIVFTLEMIPPIDSKNFYTELESKVNNNDDNDIPVSASDVLDAFCYNEAAIQYLYSQQTSTTASTTSTTPSTTSTDNDVVLKTNLEDNIVSSSSITNNLNRKVILSKILQNRAQQIKDEYMNTLFRSDTTKKLLTPKKPSTSVSTTGSSGVSRPGLAGITSGDNSNTIVRRGDRIRYVNSNSDSMVSSTSTSTSSSSSSRIIQIRQVLQKQFNINWSMSIRHSILFLFFGLFGGRTPITRTLLISGSPAVFILQSRFIKYYLKRILYFIFYNPPGIILTLLPSPYQAILSYSYTKSMNDLYGNLLPGQQQQQSASSSSSTTSVNSNVRNNSIKRQQQQQQIGASTKASPIKMKLVQQQKQEQKRVSKSTIKDDLDDDENDVDEDEELLVDDEEEEQEEDGDVDENDDDVDIDLDDEDDVDEDDD